MLSPLHQVKSLEMTEEYIEPYLNKATRSGAFLDEKQGGIPKNQKVARTDSESVSMWISWKLMDCCTFDVFPRCSPSLLFSLPRLCFVASGIWPWFLVDSSLAASLSTLSPAAVPLGSFGALDPIFLLIIAVLVSLPQTCPMSSRHLLPASCQMSAHWCFKGTYPNPSTSHHTIVNGNFNLPFTRL